MTHDPSPIRQSSAPRRRSGAASWSLLLFIVVASAATGWVIGRGSAIGESRILQAGVAAGGTAAADGAAPPVAGGTEPDGGPRDGADVDASAAKIGRLEAEILHLRVLFRRLAEVAQLDDDDGEFELDFPIDADAGDGEPRSALPSSGLQAAALLIERLDPMIAQSAPLARIFDERHRAWSRRLSGHPLPSGTLSSGFGWRLDPLGGQRVMHRGLDFVAPIGSEVLAIADGVVTWAGPNGGYGLLVELEHAEGFRTRYAHNETTIAELGAWVRKGEPIATLGSSGRSTGPHLHLEVHRRGEALDPLHYVR